MRTKCCEAKGDGFDRVKHVKPQALLRTVPSTSVVFQQCYMLLGLCAYGLQQYGHLNNSSPLCFLFSSVL